MAADVRAGLGAGLKGVKAMGTKKATEAAFFIH